MTIENFLQRIERMNTTFELPSNKTLTNQGALRLLKFYKTIIDEVTELLDCTNSEYLKENILESDPFLEDDVEPLLQNDLEINYVALADTLADLVVYVFSEAKRWGIPILEVLEIVMDSQDSKLVDGKPLMSKDGAKFIKGPYFEAPEPKIKQLLYKENKMI